MKHKKIIPGDLSEAIILLQKYQLIVKQGHESSLISEALERLRHLQTTLRYIFILSHKGQKLCLAIASSVQKNQPKIDRLNKMLEKAKIATEYYYYCAWRVHEIINKLSGLQELECPGVRGVRNDLLEHPLIFVNSFSWLGPSGPCIRPTLPRKEYIVSVQKKPGKKPGKPRDRRDKGLFINATEFADKLVRVLNVAVYSSERSVN